MANPHPFGTDDYYLYITRAGRLLLAADHYKEVVQISKAMYEGLGHADRDHIMLALRWCEFSSEAVGEAHRALVDAATDGRIWTEPTAEGALPIPVGW